MRRNTGQRALYEAWTSRSRTKPKRPGLIELLRPQLAKLRQPAAKPPVRPRPAEPAAEGPPPATLKPPKAVVKKPPMSGSEPAQPWLKAKAVQLNAGRVEASVSYQVAIMVGLGLILLLLIAFKFGQMDQRSRYATARSSRSSAGPTRAAVEGSTPPNPPLTRETASPSEPAPAATTAETPAAPTGGAAATSGGDNWIVLASHDRYADLEAAKIYFAKHDIATEIFDVADTRLIFERNGLNTKGLPNHRYMLVTDRARLFDNPGTPGTEGYAMKEKIKELGAQYDPPAGLDSFAPSRFSDAYGMKVR